VFWRPLSSTQPCSMFIHSEYMSGRAICVIINTIYLCMQNEQIMDKNMVDEIITSAFVDTELVPRCIFLD